MTKLMWCGECGDLVTPSRRDMDPKWCACERHAVWWRDGQRGLISVHDKLFPERNGGAGGKAWIIGIHNDIFLEGGREADPSILKISKEGTKYLDGNCRTRKEDVESILQDTPDSYQFKQANSLIVRISPGYSSDSEWAAVVPEPSPFTPCCGKCGMSEGDSMQMFCRHSYCPLRNKRSVK